MSETIYLAGLPRSGSTLLCNLLAQHPEIRASASSPLANLVRNMRFNWSDDPFLLSQLDNNFDEVYDRLKRSITAFIEEWTKTDSKIYVDKNRSWLQSVTTLNHLYPEFKMVVTIRDLRGIFCSVEKQHAKTLLLDFPDHMHSDFMEVRYRKLFQAEGVVGSCINNIANIANVGLGDHLFYFRFEDLMTEPQKSLNQLLKWLGMEEFEFDLDNIEQVTHESDSYYRFKYPHKIRNQLTPPSSQQDVALPPSILNAIGKNYQWFYEAFYPGLVQKQTQADVAVPVEEVEEEMVQDAEVETENKVSFAQEGDLLD